MGFSGRVLGRLFYPGWPAGFFFCILLMAVAGFRLDEVMLGGRHFAMLGAHVRSVSQGTGAYYASRPPTDIVMVRIFEVAFVGALFMPLAFFRLLRVRTNFPVAFYIGFHVVIYLLSLLGIMFTEYGHGGGPSGMECLFSCLPTCALLNYGRIHEWPYDDQNSVLGGVCLFAIVSVAVLIALQWTAWRSISSLEKTAAGLDSSRLSTPPPDVVPPAAAA
jgi:hypothetical protein